MAIVRVQKRENPFVQVDKTAINDDRLSWKAKGILVYLISKPHDWKVRIKDLVKHATDGKAAVYSGLDELERHGYMSRKQTRNEDGTFGELEYVVYEIPIEIEESPHTENQHTDKTIGKSDFSPHTDFPHTEKWDTDNRKHSNNDFKDKDFTKNDNKILNNNKQNRKIVVVADTTIKDLLQNQNIKINAKTLSKWRSLETDENIMRAIQEALERPEIKNLVGYVTRILESGYTSCTASGKVSKKLPEYVVKQNEEQQKEMFEVELEPGKRKEALELLFQLGEISEQEYREKLAEFK